jgi:hypothetical protein
MQNTLIQSTKPEAINRLINEFNRRGWEIKQLHKWANVYMVRKPSLAEYCYFIAYVSAGSGYFKLLPEKPTFESFQEAQSILECITYNT